MGSLALGLAGNGVLGVGASYTGVITDKGGQWFNVKAYGAKGDGVTDDTTAIQNAINAAATAGGGTVYAPNAPVYYLISATLVIPAGVTLAGAGLNAFDSAIVWGGTQQATAMVQMVATSATAQSFAPGIRDITLAGQGLVAIGIQVAGAFYADIRNVQVANCFYVALDVNTQSNGGSHISTEQLRVDHFWAAISQSLAKNVVSTATHSLTNNTNIGAWNTAHTLTTTSTITAGTGAGQFPSGGFLLVWAKDPNGHWQHVLVQYTGLVTGANGSFTGCTIVGYNSTTGTLSGINGFSNLGSLTPALNTGTAAGLTTIQFANGYTQRGIRVDGDTTSDCFDSLFTSTRCDYVNVPAVDILNMDTCSFINPVGTKLAASTLNPPAFTLHGGSTYNNSARSIAFDHGTTGAGGLVLYGTAQGSIASTPWAYANITETVAAVDIAYRFYGIINNEPLPGVGTAGTLLFNTDTAANSSGYNNLAGNSPGALLTAVHYNPSTAATVQATTSSYVDIDATNLKTATFVYPPSGQVDVTLTAVAYYNTGTTATGVNLQWRVFDVGTQNASSLLWECTALAMSGSGAAVNAVTTAAFGVTRTLRVTGTPGATGQLKWQHLSTAQPAGSAVYTLYGGSGAGNGWGPARMEVRAA